MDCSTRPSNVRVCQFRHPSKQKTKCALPLPRLRRAASRNPAENLLSSGIARRRKAMCDLARNLAQHLRIRREFLHKRQQALDGFLRFVTGKAAADDVDFVE